MGTNIWTRDVPPAGRQRGLFERCSSAPVRAAIAHPQPFSPPQVAISERDGEGGDAADDINDDDIDFDSYLDELTAEVEVRTFSPAGATDAQTQATTA